MELDQPTGEYPDDAMMRRLTRFVTGHASDAERAEVGAWIEDDPARARLVDELGAASRAMQRLPSHYDSTRAWERVARRTGLSSGGASELRLPFDRAGSAHTRARPEEGRGSAGARLPRTGAAAWAVLSRYGWRVAAAVVLAVGVAVGGPLVRGTVEPGPEVAIAQTATGELHELLLPDGSRVTLGPLSRITYARGADGSRLIDLEGVAVFDVKRDADAPFLVRAGSLVTRVLGTRFVVRAYRAEPTVRVVVDEGQVALEAAPSVSFPRSVLGPGDVAEMHGDAQPTITRGTGSAGEFQWTVGRLSFEQEPLPEVVEELARWYGWKIELGDPALAGRRVTVTVERNSLEEALEAIALSLGARVERRGETLILVPRGGSATGESVSDGPTN